MNNNIFNNRYSKALTVMLIIVIIAVIGLLAFLGYDVYRKYNLESESSEAVSRFEEEINKIGNTQTDTSNEITNEVLPNIDLNTLMENTTTGDSNNSSGSTVKYKGYDVIGIIEIPKTNIKYPIIKQDDVSIDSLDVAICNLYGELNQPGSNAVLVGHNYRNGTFFSNNKKLSKGDKIYITDSSGKKVTYVIYKKYETSTGDFDYATRKVGDKREISLSTCTDDTKKRLVIWAEEE